MQTKEKAKKASGETRSAPSAREKKLSAELVVWRIFAVVVFAVAAARLFERETDRLILQILRFEEAVLAVSEGAEEFFRGRALIFEKRAAKGGIRAGVGLPHIVSG